MNIKPVNKIPRLLTFFATLLLLTACGSADVAVEKPVVEASAAGSIGSTGSTDPKLSVQLWSVNKDVASDFEGTLATLAGMGFEGVEFAGDFGSYKENPEGLKLFLQSLGLEGSGAHVGFDKLNAENFDATVAFYKALGVTTLIVPFDERAFHPEQVKEVVAELNALSEKLAPYGMQMGYHNHSQEFADYEDATYWDYIARNTADEVVMQLDVAWAVNAGKDPIEYVKRYPGRTLTTHYKVMPPENAEQQSPIIGDDSLDWLALSQTNIEFGGTQWFVVEQEAYPEGMTPLESVKASKEGLERLLSGL